MLCNNGKLAGDIVEADVIDLTIVNGASHVPSEDPQTTVEVLIPLL